jgi:phosphatidylethanolamine/phosphatidyl-N-methylethanolamine N-methyltransferase
VFGGERKVIAQPVSVESSRQEAVDRDIMAGDMARQDAGWRPEFRWQRLAQWAAGHGGVRLVERKAMPPLGLFSLIRFERVGKGAMNGQRR